MSKILVIDNYDSFTYNLVHMLRKLVPKDRLSVVRNDAFELSIVEDYEHILLSPGPGVPKDTGLMPQVLAKYADTKNILGVCLGHQGIGEHFGGKLLNLSKVYHGVVTPIEVVENDLLFKNIPHTFNACRYHSWVIERDSIPEDILVTSIADNGNVMSIKHKFLKVRGVQFHPESIMTEHGEILIENWLRL